jgi:chromosomal replication initiation ATPase DnaA
MTYKQITKLYLSTKEIAEAQHDYISHLEDALRERGCSEDYFISIKERKIILDTDGYENFRTAKRMNMHRILNAASKYYNVNREHILGTKRDIAYAIPRHIVSYLAKRVYRKDMSLKQIGEFMGGRDHSTIIHSIRAVENQLSYDKNFQIEIEELKLMLSE